MKNMKWIILKNDDFLNYRVLKYVFVKSKFSIKIPLCGINFILRAHDLNLARHDSLPKN